jgi:hypothetical protein
MTTRPIKDYVPRQTLASYQSYAEAQRAVDYLSDNHFPVNHVAIVGVDLRLLEKVTGRLDTWRATLRGAGTGAWFGLLIGLFLALFSTTTASFLVILLWGIVWGVMAGAIFGLVSYLMTGGQRDFSSTSTLVASRYEVTVDDAVADRARQMLSQLEPAPPGPGAETGQGPSVEAPGL